ncbi:HEAT repeat domain-containing protein [Vibrio sp. D431a]|uniref:HEAT repeat domain-containing protein n=1 Tax=Vibrio sp. D431a TaxID=2837388 RepID=UPI002554AB82|nr:hypothetical protein [Vibrio sp. D431a]MDK9789831.1 hypothetical protein [Vibrio sp. D431a]
MTKSLLAKFFTKPVRKCDFSAKTKEQKIEIIKRPSRIKHEELMELAKDVSVEVRCTVACHSEDYQDILAMLASDESVLVRTWVASLIRYDASNSNVIEKLLVGADTSLMRILASRFGGTSSLVRDIALSHPDDVVRTMALESFGFSKFLIDPSVLESLIADESESVLYALLSVVDSMMDQQAIRLIAKSCSSPLVRRLALVYELEMPSDEDRNGFHAQMANDDNWLVRIALAYYTTSTKAIAMLAEDSNLNVRLVVAARAGFADGDVPNSVVDLFSGEQEKDMYKYSLVMSRYHTDAVQLLPEVFLKYIFYGQQG